VFDEAMNLLADDTSLSLYTGQLSVEFSDDADGRQEWLDGIWKEIISRYFTGMVSIVSSR
jgi:hypothetical protein